MHNFKLVQSPQTSHDLNEYLPYNGLAEISAVFLVLHYFLEKVSVVRIFHHNANEHLTYQRLWEASSRKASLYSMIFGCLTEARMRTSLSAFFCSFSDKLGSLTRFKAYSVLSASRLTL